MKFKKSVLAAAILTLLLGAPAYAETDGWGAVAGEPESSAWGAGSETLEVDPAQTQAEPSAWGAETVSEAVKAEPAKPAQAACGKDDPRYARIAPVLKELQAGQSIEPLQTSFATYATMNSKIRSILGENIYISSADCSEQHLFEGELTGKVTVAFTEIWQIINDTLRTDDQAMMSFVAKNTRAAPEPALSVISMVQFVHLDDSQIRKLYAVVAPGKAKQPELDKPLMLELFLMFAGTVNEADKGKTAYLQAEYYSHDKDILKAIYLEKNSGETQTPGFGREFDMVTRVSSMLKATGLDIKVVGKDAKDLASQ